MQNKRGGFVIDKKEQCILAAVATELISNTKIDYYPETNTVKIFYYGPKRMTIKQMEARTTSVSEERYYLK